MLPYRTIVAPATPPGEGGVGIIRLSGPRAVEFLDEVFKGSKAASMMKSHQLYYGNLYNREGKRVDEVLAVVMRAPRSYTGEDVVEVHCHGGVQISRAVIDLFLQTGASMAAPGEFTQRAFLNGRMDLAQAEAVIDVIKARSDRASRVALDQLDGHLSQKIHGFSRQLKDSLALVEAHIDFQDDEVGTLDLPGLLDPVRALSTEMSSLANTFDFGRALREGVNVLILGRPNVGKSSLMNVLLGESRSIVTEVAGTTRDILEEQLVLGGFPVRLVDAAGVRETDDRVEQEGVRRARDKALSADLILMVVDGSQPLAREDFLVVGLCNLNKTILVVNKCDQEQRIALEALPTISSHVFISAKHNLGITELREVVVGYLGDEQVFSAGEGVVVTERRHRDALLQAITALTSFLRTAETFTALEFLAMELREALSALGQITGETTPDEILDQIFSRFCIGK